MSFIKKIKAVGVETKAMEIQIKCTQVRFEVALDKLTAKEQESLQNDELIVEWKKGAHKDTSNPIPVKMNGNLFEASTSIYFSKVAEFRWNKKG